MDSTALKAQKREKSSKGALNALRRNGRVPAVVYGLKLDPELIEVAFSDLRPILQLNNKPVALDIDGKVQNVMVKLVDRSAIKREVKHVDFLRVDDQASVVARIPLATEGIAKGIKAQGGAFSMHKKWVKVRARVSDLPEVFTVDITEMEAGTTFCVRDLKFEKGTLLTPAKTALFGISSARVKEETPAEKAAAEKGKK